ncbi:MAG: efflux RND transporter periplasmic adaptor subunit [Candidatus Omnitrophica bacterium]|nr:efflux RND transporter periplasmic adaptor subunit [Candidatus Omnitrophota bacterium]
MIVLVILARTTSNIQRVLFKKRPEAAKKAPAITFEEEVSPVKAFKIKKTDFKDTLPCIGNVKGFKEIELKFQTAGIIESFNFEEGEKIQEGDIIASLIQKDALLKLKYTEIELNKNQKLFEIGAISSMKMDQAKLEYESAKSELDKTNIYAMSNGLLGSRIIDVGSYVTPNDKAGTFVNIDKVYAEFNIIEKDVPKLALGQKAEVFIDAYPNKSFAGAIDRIAPVIEGRSRTQNVKVELDNKEGVLKPGMFTRALISTYEKKEALVIPASGLKKKEADYFVYVVHKEEPKKEPTEEASKGKAKKKFWLPIGRKKEGPKPEIKEKEAELGSIEVRKIKLGYMTQDLVEIEDGVKEDELIVIEIQEEFKDKVRVEITEVQEGLF